MPAMQVTGDHGGNPSYLRLKNYLQKLLLMTALSEILLTSSHTYTLRILVDSKYDNNRAASFSDRDSI